MSKRALHRALYGFNRRSGGKKHKPKAKAKSIGKRPVAGAVGEKNTLLFVVVHSCLLLFLLCSAQSGKCFLKFKPFTLQECFFSSPGRVELALLRKVALPCRLRSAATMAGRLRGRSGRQSLRTHLGLSPAGPKASTLAAPAPVVAPRYSYPPPAPIRRGTEEPAEDRHGGRSRSRARRRRRHKKAKPAERPAERPAPKKPPTSSSDSSSKEEVEEEPSGPAAASSSLMVAVPKAPQTGAVPLWLQNKVDSLTSKAASFSRALTRAQQALRTSARIAREAAVSFESELDNFTAAQKDIEKAFGKAE